jgi:hypothetical protein
VLRPSVLAGFRLVFLLWHMPARLYWELLRRGCG